VCNERVQTGLIVSQYFFFFIALEEEMIALDALRRESNPLSYCFQIK